VIRQGGWSLLSDGKILKTSSRDHQARAHSDQMVLVMARREADPHKRRWTQGLHSHKQKSRATQDAQMRVLKQL
jgi:hypothetical protein